VNPGAFAQWAEKRAANLGSRNNLARSFLSTIWVLLGFPLLFLLTAELGIGSLPVALVIATLLTGLGYAGSIRLVRRWATKNG
jgi:hypothetical protein